MVIIQFYMKYTWVIIIYKTVRQTPSSYSSQIETVNSSECNIPIKYGISLLNAEHAE